MTKLNTALKLELAKTFLLDFKKILELEMMQIILKYESSKKCYNLFQVVGGDTILVYRYEKLKKNIGMFKTLHFLQECIKDL